MRGQECHRLEPKAIEVLVYLAARPGRVVSREELLSQVWPGVVVGDDALTQAIIKLRKALGDDAHRPTFIETISKRGYRLIAPVGSAAPPGELAAVPVAAHARRRPLALAVLAALVASGALLLPKWLDAPWPIGGNEKGAAVPLTHPVIAVLPLANLSGDPRRDYFSDGVTEDVIAALGRFSGVRVISRNSVEPFRGRPAPARAVRGELGARYIVTGSVREAGGRLRVAVELGDTGSETVIWSDRYEGPASEIFEIQDRIARNIVGALAVKVTRLEQQRASAKRPGSLEAYDLVLRARRLVETSERGSNREARMLLSKALELAPDYPEAQAEMGRAEVARAVYGWIEDPNEALVRAEQLMQRAAAGGSPGAEARARGLLANLYSIQGRYDQAIAESNRALELNPSDAIVYEYRSAALLFLGRIDEALASAERALRFDPAGSSVSTRFRLALAYYTVGRYADALAVSAQNLARYPEAPFVHAMHAAILARLDRNEEARLAADQVRRLNPFFRVEEFGTRFSNPAHTEKLQEGLRKAGL